MKTHFKIYLHFILMVEHPELAIPCACKHQLHEFIRKQVEHRKSELLAINCMPDHLHLFVSLRPVVTVNDFIQKIKAESTEYINAQRWIARKFVWADGYGCFSYSHSHLERVSNYISNQERHHLIRGFADEYEDFLRKYRIVIEEQKNLAHNG